MSQMNIKNNSTSSSAGEASWPRVVKVLLILLSLLYLLSSIASFIVLAATSPDGSGVQLRSQMAKGGLQQGLIALICISGIILVLRKSNIANLAVAFAGVVTGFVALKALASSIAKGLSYYSLVEPLIVLPSVICLLWSVVRRR